MKPDRSKSTNNKIITGEIKHEGKSILLHFGDSVIKMLYILIICHHEISYKLLQNVSIFAKNQVKSHTI